MAGVDLYFALSGFIITMMCLGRFQRRGEATRFLKRRFLRIYPTYWVWCAAVLAVFVVQPNVVNSGHGPPDVLRSILLLPQRNLPLLLVAWTLVYEVFSLSGLCRRTALAARSRPALGPGAFGRLSS